MTIITDLPEEIIRSIIDEFWLDLPSLATCALVCRSWHLPAQTLRFHSIEFPGYEETSLFRKILKHSTYIAPLIKRVKVSLNHSPFDYRAYEKLFKTLPLLTQIQHLSLSPHTSGLQWDDLPLSFQIALVITLRRQSLTSLELESWKFSSGGLDLRRSIRLPAALTRLVLGNLHVCGGIIEMDAKYKDLDAKPRARPRDLVLTSTPSPEIEAWLFRPDCTIDLRSVRKIQIHSADDFASRLLKLTASSVEIVEFPPQSLEGSAAIDFSSNSILNTLILSAHIDTDSLEVSLSTWVEASVLSFPADSQLETLRINLHPRSNANEIDLTAFGRNCWTYGPEWTRLTSVLVSSKFVFLRKVDIFLVGPQTRYPMQVEVIRDALRALGSKLSVQRKD